MGKVFFVDWALWQKMTFVLACAIVLTIGIGWIKVLHTNRKMKKLTKPVGARATQEPQMVEAAAVPRRKSGDEIPFGIRAIQSGIEVDGIWISGTNTPVPSSPTQSAHDKPEASGSNSRPMSTLEMPPSAAGPSSGPSSRPSSRGPPSSNFDRAVSAERLPNHSRDSSPGSTASGQRARQHRPPPTAYSRYSQSNMLRHSATLDTLEGEDEDAQMMAERSASANANPYGYTFSSNGSSRKSSGSSDNNPQDRSSDDDNTTTSTAMGKAPMMAVPRPRDPRTDLRLLQSHRMSHVAETGSLARRERPDRPTGRSGDWSNMTLDPYSRSAPTSGRSSPPSDPTSGPPSPPTPPIAQGSNPFMAPLESVNSPTRDSHPDNTAAHAVPLLETYQPRGPNFDDDAPQAFQHGRESQVLRKVNSGFEILRPGTFPVGPTEENLRAQQPPKKLQKKRRPSETDSRVSSFVEQV